MSKLRIGLVADIHAGVTRTNIRSDRAIDLLDAVIADANQRDLDLFVTLGDNVNATSIEEDRRYLGEVATALRKSTARVVPLFGNNEMKFLGAEEAARVLDCSPGSEMRSVNGWTLIFWRTECELSLANGLRLREEELAWLTSALERAAYPAVIFTHAPIDSNAMIGNYYFQERADLGSYTNSRDARALIAASGKVVLVLAGHVHWHSGSTISGIHHRTLPSLTDTFECSGEPSGAWAVLELDSGRMSLEVFGREPMSWAAPPRARHSAWYEPMPRDAFSSRMTKLWSERTADAAE